VGLATGNRFAGVNHLRRIEGSKSCARPTGQPSLG
jgi:hypothetical protein